MNARLNMMTSQLNVMTAQLSLVVAQTASLSELVGPTPAGSMAMAVSVNFPSAGTKAVAMTRRA